MHSIELYQTHLDRVSRSFAFCIRRLDGDMRLRTSLAYLLFRALDTIEDANFPGGDKGEAAREKQFLVFESFLSECPTKDALRDWVSGFPLTVSTGERALLADALFVFEDFHALPEKVRSDIRHCALRMSGGMRHYSARRAAAGELRLRGLTDVNRYCYFVAGVVGELLTRLMMDRTPVPYAEKILLKNAFHFGLFLQKINLLKDQEGDELERRFLVPDRQVLVSSLLENANGAWEYLNALPLEEKGYRVFCAWSLFLGAASLPWIQSSGRIPRAITLKLLADVEGMIDDNQALKKAFDDYFSGLPSLEPVSTLTLSSESLDWFHPLSGGSLQVGELNELRVV